MGKKLTPAEEAEVLREVTREAHGVLKDLTAALKEAKALAPKLIQEFEATHRREIDQLNKHMAAEIRRCADTINSGTKEAREFIVNYLMAGTATIDSHTGQAIISWNPGEITATSTPYVPPKQTPEQHP